MRELRSVLTYLPQLGDDDDEQDPFAEVRALMRHGRPICLLSSLDRRGLRGGGS